MTTPTGPNTSRRAREAAARLRESNILTLPTDRNPRQLWLLVRADPADNRPGCFFVTHAENYTKFSTRPGFQVLSHSYDQEALRTEARAATLACGPSFQPPF